MRQFRHHWIIAQVFFLVSIPSYSASAFRDDFTGTWESMLGGEFVVTHSSPTSVTVQARTRSYGVDANGKTQKISSGVFSKLQGIWIAGYVLSVDDPIKYSAAITQSKSGSAMKGNFTASVRIVKDRKTRKIQVHGTFSAKTSAKQEVNAKSAPCKAIFSSRDLEINIGITRVTGSVPEVFKSKVMGDLLVKSLSSISHSDTLSSLDPDPNATFELLEKCEGSVLKPKKPPGCS